ncbi:MAG: helix-turn-helix domain-containing protein [Treponema sp.]|jgi:excisionase family DNA binding protein|nr:helix-turn-helix domain-containing protein [Treponema sp.]
MTLLNIKEAGKELRLAPITVRRRVRAGEIPYRKMGGRIFFTETDLQTYLEAAAVPAKKKRASNV